MRVLRSFGTLALVSLMVAACGTATPTPAPGATQGPAGPTTNPGGGGGVLPGNGSGKVNFEISGPVQKVGEVPFFGIGSRFGGPAGILFTFTDTDADTEIVSISPDPTNPDAWTVGYISEDFTVSSITCAVSNMNVTATSASGAFDCQNAIYSKPDGTYETNARIKGTFEARP